MRGEKAQQLLERGLKVKEYEFILKEFSENNQYSFGIKNNIDLGIRYDPSTIIYGMDFYVFLASGYKIYRRKRAIRGIKNRVTKEYSIKWF
eukprot:Gb_08489 [translate_table: standard]